MSHIFCSILRSLMIPPMLNCRGRDDSIKKYAWHYPSNQGRSPRTESSTNDETGGNITEEESSEISTIPTDETIKCSPTVSSAKDKPAMRAARQTKRIIAPREIDSFPEIY